MKTNSKGVPRKTWNEIDNGLNEKKLTRFDLAVSTRELAASARP